LPAQPAQAASLAQNTDFTACDGFSRRIKNAGNSLKFVAAGCMGIESDLDNFVCDVAPVTKTTGLTNLEITGKIAN
jgi:hypothetical protein